MSYGRGRRKPKMTCPTCGRLIAYSHHRFGDPARIFRRIYRHDGMALAPGRNIHSARYKRCPTTLVVAHRYDGWVWRSCHTPVVDSDSALPEGSTDVRSDEG